MKLTGENRRTRGGGGGKPVPMPLCPPQIPHGLIRDRTRASAVEARRLTAWAVARPRCSFATLVTFPVEVSHGQDYVLCALLQGMVIFPNFDWDIYECAEQICFIPCPLSQQRRFFLSEHSEKSNLSLLTSWQGSPSSDCTCLSPSPLLFSPLICSAYGV
jgi:hypothetical protein